MSHTTFLFREDHARIANVLDRLLADASARAVFVVNPSGEPIASAGEVAGLDATSLGSLAAGNVAATHGLARLLGEVEGFSSLFHEGTREHLHVNVVAGGRILMVWFDRRSSLGLVRLRAKRATAELTALFDDIAVRSFLTPSEAPARSPLRGLTDDDIDALFR